MNDPDSSAHRVQGEASIESERATGATDFHGQPPAVEIDLPSERRMKLPDGPRMPRFLQTLSLGLRPTAFYDACARRFGDCFTLRIISFPPQIMFSHPEAIREIFSADGREVHAGRANDILRLLIGPHSLLALDGERHLRERRLMLPPFHGERMKAYFETIRAVVDRAIDGWPVGKAFAIHDEMQKITLEVILRTVFGVDEEAADFARVRDLLVRFATEGATPANALPALQIDLGPLSPWGRYVRLRREIHETLSREIARRRARPEPRSDVLSMLLEARDEDGTALGEEEIRDQMLTLLLAGHETTATSLAWAVHRILTEPEIAPRLRGELEGVSGEGPLRPEALPELRYLEAVVKETLRLNPILPEVGRWLDRPTTIGGHELPAGVVVCPSIYLAHRRPDRWPEPERFRPERFLESRPGPYEFLPFGGGLRRCLGMAFALYEMKIVLAEVLRRLALRRAGGRPRVTRRSITLAPSGGVPVVIERRAA